MALNNEAREFFAKQGRRGGKARAKNMTVQERKEAARKAVQARWKKVKQEKE
jgi:hypothetical protein